MGLGLVQVYSASYIFSAESMGDGHYYFNRQLIFVLMALTVLFVIALSPSKFLKSIGPWVWIISSGFLILTLVSGIGVKVGGAARWISLPFGFRLEPAEFVKIGLSFFLASWIARQETILRKLHPLICTALVAIPLGLLLMQPDFGSFVLCILSLLSILFIFGLPWKYIISAILFAIPSFYILVMKVPYRRARVMAFLDPWADPEQKGFQVIQSMLGFHAGGLTGVGLGRGQGKLFFLPEAHTDFTLAVFGEETGFVGIFCLLSLYGFVIYKGFKIAQKQNEIFHRCLSLGLVVMFALSVFINAGVSMALLPTKGLTLPFMSYGGSSLLSMAVLFGVLLRLDTLVVGKK